ncbi:hypothetical protein [Sutcliffiella deserti]|nr:hypothetical protein [Sutcliffiella deserti]
MGLFIRFSPLIYAFLAGVITVFLDAPGYLVVTNVLLGMIAGRLMDESLE